MPIILLDASLASTVSDVITVFTSVWTFISGNWYLMALLAVPLVAMVLSMVIRTFRG